MTVNDEDYNLTQQAAMGDRQATELLIEKYKAYAYSLALKLLNNAEDAEEAAHDAFIKALGALGQFDGRSKFKTWLFRIVYNTSLTYLRRRKGKEVDSIEDRIDFDINLSYEDDTLRKKDMERLISTSMEKLGTSERAVIQLFYFKQNSLDEIGEILNIENNNAKVRLHRARRKLAKILVEMHKEEIKELL